MKSKISPTSPKNAIESKNDLDELYREPLKKIEKPRQKVTNGVWYLFFSALFGILGGVLGMLVLLSYGPDIPYLDKIISYGLTSPLYTVSVRNHQNAASADLTKLIAKNASAIVSIFEKKTVADDLTSAYQGWESRGNGFVLTNDGYIITTQNTATAKKDLVVITNDGALYTVDRNIIDPATHLAFLKVKATNLTTVGVAKLTDLAVADEIVLLKQNDLLQPPIVTSNSISSLTYADKLANSSGILSSDQFNRSILLSNQLAPYFDSALAFSLTGDIIGITIHGDRDVVIPFAEIKNIQENILNNTLPQRPILGVHYLTITSAVGLPSSMTQGLTKGVIITTDSEDTRPSIISKSPAQKAGLKKDDIILAVDKESIDATNDLADLILEHNPGDLITLSIVHNGKNSDVKITLDEQTN
jgi:S1-C subfamily serine protease